MKQLNDAEKAQDISHNIGMLIKRLGNYDLICDLFLDEDVRFKVAAVFNNVAEMFLQENISKLNLPEEYVHEKWRGLRLVREILSLDKRKEASIADILDEILCHKNADPKYLDI